ncbi:WD repeat-containing protein 82 [Zancudomyces culisetae]|uniref:WD repeat-containing protein 82 n=1 Tax=Zancudomyces culisetae TaxID=1213189 RepID=A0A1R1PR37_ZANCU|nr:WD repeat-containing protein 82 [Zancudomyces culisetae]|eukprot:OMH83455.1 WD repeat-containing protein 82 [Zancudomyces culisetae]
MPSVATSLNQSLDCENNNFCSNSESLTNIDYNPYTGNNYTKSKIKKGSTPSLKDVFVTGSLDKTVKLWDLNVESSVLSTTISDSHAEFGISVDFDPTGVVVGIASGHQIKLHDIRYFGKGPFLSADIGAQLKDDLNTPQFLSFVSSEPIKNVITGLRFGKLSGENMIVSTTKGDKFVVDSFSGKVLLNLESVRDSNYRYDSGIRSSNYYQRNSHNFDFSPCEKYVVSGDNDGKIRVWNVYDPLNKLVLQEHSLEKSGLSETLVVKNCSLWESTRKSPVYSLGLSPGFLMAISGSDDLCFWFLMVGIETQKLLLYAYCAQYA